MEAYHLSSLRTFLHHFQWGSRIWYDDGRGAPVRWGPVRSGTVRSGAVRWGAGVRWRAVGSSGVQWCLSERGSFRVLVGRGREEREGGEEGRKGKEGSGFWIHLLLRCFGYSGSQEGSSRGCSGREVEEKSCATAGVRNGMGEAGRGKEEGCRTRHPMR